MDGVLGKLAELRDRGFQFMNIPDEDGRLDRIMGYRQLRGFVDTILFRSEHDAKAGRMPAAHDSSQAGKAVWLFEGSLAEAIDRLLELPPPGAPTAPTLAGSSAEPELVPAPLNPFRIWTPREGIA
ncbi:hypothetical protein [Kutzneria buriramensis]|uniref:Uncharacterized protein n=1 Tax=Kutzneria buriramensis TaxID=1045776 RepID=A0A3E0HU59_9PSEU|nr:hypothetical protein [Kutzneria buriramensis]REH49949.1 hypothetical protein BCF44_104215 [Kutzneria buriramensis]